MSQTLRTTVQRGKEPGITLAPHRYADGCYVAFKHNSRHPDYWRYLSPTKAQTPDG